MSSLIRVDLHCHSNLSDGDLSPERVAQEAAAAGVVWAALTDHNTTGGQERFRAALEGRAVRAIPGAELDVQSFLGPVHLLAYGFDPGDRAFARTARSLRSPAWSALRRRLGRSNPPGHLRAHRSDGRLDALEAIRIVHAAGGRAFLAHPLAGLDGQADLERLLDRLAPAGLDGLEAFYKPYPEATRLALLATAGRRGLLASAGSDFHGPYFPGGASPGFDMPEEHWSRLLAALPLR